MIIVQRQPADKPGEDITSSILVSTAAQVERGRQEINFNSTDRIIKTGSVVASTFITPGELIMTKTRDGDRVGMLTEYGVSIGDNGKVSTEIAIECVK